MQFNFLVWTQKIGPTQNILGPVEGRGKKKSLVQIYFILLCCFFEDQK